jgi:allophanate hydrolase subunit 2
MDDRALRLGNRLLGNAEGEAALEITLNGPTLKFNTDVQAVVCGAPLAVTLDGVDQPLDCVFYSGGGDAEAGRDKRRGGQKLSLPERRHSGAGLFGR